MATAGYADPSVSALVERDSRTGAQKLGAKLGAGLAKAFGGGSKKQAEYGKSLANLAGDLHSKAMPQVKSFVREQGKKLMAKGLAKAKSYIGLKKGGKAWKKMCKGGKCGKRKMVSFKARGKEVRFAAGGKVRHPPGRF